VRNELDYQEQRNGLIWVREPEGSNLKREKKSGSLIIFVQIGTKNSKMINRTVTTPAHGSTERLKPPNDPGAYKNNKDIDVGKKGVQHGVGGRETKDSSSRKHPRKIQHGSGRPRFFFGGVWGEGGGYYCDEGDNERRKGGRRK